MKQKNLYAHLLVHLKKIKSIVQMGVWVNVKTFNSYPDEKLQRKSFEGFIKN